MNKRVLLSIFLVCAAVFVGGLIQLLKIRFESGDVYPPYSSLRADPLGVMAFCESLEAIPGISVRRDFSANNRLPDGKDTAYLHLAAPSHQWSWAPEELVKEIEGFVTSGGRLVITFYPEQTKSFHLLEADDNDEPGKGAAKKNKQKRSPEETREAHQTSLKERWGLDFAVIGLETHATNTARSATVSRQADLPLPEMLEWHSAIVFTNLPAFWRAIYARDEHPVLVERRFGRGTVVIASDSYFLSNEALRKEPHPDLLSWLLGPSKRVIFDEAHFGVVETAGVSHLIRKYRLLGVALVLITLAVLFIWKNSVNFVPPYAAPVDESWVTGKDAASGFVNLLRRNVATRDVLAVCFAEWKKSFAMKGRTPAAKLAQADAILEAENARRPLERDPLAAYREICRIMKHTQL